MKSKKICYLILVLLLGCSKQRQVTSTALPFTVTTILTPETKQLDDVRNNVSAFLKAKDYNKLDELAAQLRSSKAQDADGFWELSEFYFALTVSNNIYGLPMYSDIPDKAFEDRLAELQDWVKAKPKSITARVALANVQVDYAWNARGGGYAYTVTDKGWQLLGERLDEAAKTLLEVKNMDKQCPKYWSVVMSVALGMQLPKEQLNNIFKQEITYEPDFLAYYVSRANYLLPRWDGSQGEWENDLAKSSDKIGGDDGDVLYARVVWNLNRSTAFDNIFRESDLSWPRVKRGLEILEKRYPNSLAVMNEGAYLAVFAHDAPTARKFFDDTKGQMDKTIWKSQDEFRRFATYAYTLKETLVQAGPVRLRRAGIPRRLASVPLVCSFRRFEFAPAPRQTFNQLLDAVSRKTDLPQIHPRYRTAHRFTPSRLPLRSGSQVSSFRRTRTRFLLRSFSMARFL